MPAPARVIPEVRPAPEPEPAKPPVAEVRPAPIRIAQAAQPAPAPPPTNGSHLISFDFKDADVVNLLRILASESGKNIVIGEAPKGKMSVRLQHGPRGPACAASHAQQRRPDSGED